MLCAIYKSQQREGCYLYTPNKAKFEDLPEQLMQYFGKPELVMLFNLLGKKKLAQVTNEQVLQAIQQQGYYLQLLPQQENLLQRYLQQKAISHHNQS